MPRDFAANANLNGGDLAIFNGFSEMSWQLWVRQFDLISDQIFWEKCNGSFDGLSAWFDRTGQGATEVYEYYANAGERAAHNVSNAVQDKWVSIAGYCDFTGSKLSVLYVNGQPAGDMTVTLNRMAGQSLLLGVHTGPQRFLNGSLGPFTVWNEELTPAEFQQLADGGDPATVHPSGLVRQWRIIGDTSPEPEFIDGSDTLIVTNTTQSAPPQIKVLSASTGAAGEIDIGCITDTNVSDLVAYVSPSATPPTPEDLISGAGAVAHGMIPRASNIVTGFSGNNLLDADNGAHQCVATDGTYYFVTAGQSAPPENNKAILIYDLNWNLLWQYDTQADNGNAHAQVNGLYPEGNKLYVSANNFPQETPIRGWIFEYDLNPATGEITFVQSTELFPGRWTEHMYKYLGDWWVVSHDYHGIDRFDTNFSLVKSYDFPADTRPGTEVSLWQGIFWRDDTVYINVHNNNSDSPLTQSWKYLAPQDELVFLENLRPPTLNCTQGFWLESDNESVLWAERITTAEGNVRQTTGMTIGDSEYTFLGALTGVPGGDYYVHVLHNLNFGVIGADFPSNILTSQQITVPSAGPATLTNATGIATGPTTASGTVDTNSGAGTLFYLTSVNSFESAAAIKAGNSQAVTSSGTQSVTDTGLLENTQYYIHYLQDNGSGDSNIERSGPFTTPLAPVAPVLTNPTATATGTTTCSGTVDTDSSDGTLFYLVSQNPVETSTAIRAGSSQPVTVAGTQNITEIGLLSGTGYYIHYLHANGEGDSNIARSTLFFTEFPVATLTLPTAVATNTTIAASVTTDTGGGTLYYLATTSATATPAEIKAGSARTVTAAGVQNFNISGLQETTLYYVHSIQVTSGDSNQVVASDTTGLRPPSNNLNEAILIATGGPTLNEGLLSHYQANGATSNDLNTAEYEFLIAATAAPGHVNDMWFKLLRGAGYTGALNDMLLQFWQQGGTFV